MTRYFFHIEDGHAAQDDEGIEFATLAEAKCEAVKLAGQHICDAAGTFWDTQEWLLTTTDETGLTLFALQFTGNEAPVLMARPVPSARQPSDPRPQPAGDQPEPVIAAL
ncbi:MAG TPA: hypothetical protein VF552_03985 [Allosphingosinicella sp.]|jgi:hypothetical protein